MTSIHQALFGERDRGHGLIESSRGAPDQILRLLESRTDLPPNRPTGVEWSPFYCGFPLDGWYVVSRTVPDHGASRGGMVLTHVLLVDAELAAATRELHTLLIHLPNRVQRASSLAALEALEPVTPVGESGIPNDRVVLLARHLVDPRTDPPARWFGDEEFMGALANIWRHLWPYARQRLRFGLSFRPEDIGPEPLDIVLIPEGARRFWPIQQQDVQTARQHPLEPPEAFLLGQPEGQALRNLEEELGAQLRKLSDLSFLAAIANGLGQTVTAESAEVRRLARQIGAISPDPQKGRELKTRVFDRLVESVSTGGPEDLTGLRNFNPSPFPSGRERLTDAMGVWVGNAFQDVDRLPEISEALLSAFESDIDGWSDVVRDATVRELTEWAAGQGVALWGLMQSSPRLITHLEAHLPMSEAVEADLAESCPQLLAKEVATDMLALASTRGWFSLHAACCAASMPPEVAIEAHYSLAEPAGTFVGVRQLTRRLPAGSLVDAAVQIGEPTLVAAAGELCAEDSKLRAGIDPHEKGWRDVWAASVRDGVDPMRGIKKPQQVMFGLLDVIQEGEAVADSLLAALASTDRSSLLGYPSRRDIWGALSDVPRGKMLESTAAAWLETTNPGAAPVDLEEPLRLAALSVLTCRDPGHSLDHGTQLAFLRELGIEAPDFDKWLRKISEEGTLDRKVAQNIGGFVHDREWRSTARFVCDLYLSGRRDLAPAVRQFSGLLGLLARFQVGMTDIEGWSYRASKDAWDLLYKVAIQLYPEGPRDIWARAGGDPSTLETDGSGQVQWQRALVMARSGGGGKDLSPRSLTSEMLTDFPKNEMLRALGKKKAWL